VYRAGRYAKISALFALFAYPFLSLPGYERKQGDC